VAKPSTQKTPHYNYHEDEYKLPKKQKFAQRKNKRKLKQALRQQDWETVSSMSDYDRKT